MVRWIVGKDLPVWAEHGRRVRSFPWRIRLFAFHSGKRWCREKFRAREAHERWPILINFNQIHLILPIENLDLLKICSNFNKTLITSCCSYLCWLSFVFSRGRRLGYEWDMNRAEVFTTHSKLELPENLRFLWRLFFASFTKFKYPVMVCDNLFDQINFLC